MDSGTPRKEEEDAFDGWEGVQAIRAAQRMYGRRRKWWLEEKASTTDIVLVWTVLVAMTALAVWAVLITK